MNDKSLLVQRSSARYKKKKKKEMQNRDIARI